jgi:hypothetical protein
VALNRGHNIHTLHTVLPDKLQFQALRYKNDGEICVVQGPIEKFTIPSIGFGVICYGLVSASYLNGELGEKRERR